MVNASMVYGQPENVERMSDFFITYLNSQTGGAWVASLALISFGLPFMATLEYGAKKAFGAGVFNFMITMVMLTAFGLSGVGFYYVLGAVGLAVALVINNSGGVAA